MMKQADAAPDHALRFAVMFTRMRLEWLESLPLEVKKDASPCCVGCHQPFIRGLEVTPPSVTLAPRGTQQFQAMLFGRPVNVTWSATTGTIDASGTLTAGTTPGTFEVRATNPVDGRSTAATFTIAGTTTTTTIPTAPDLEGLWAGPFTFAPADGGSVERVAPECR